MTQARVAGRTKFLIALLGGSGVLHFVRPAPFVAIVPRFLPRARDLVFASGAVELLGAGLLSAPRTRKIGGLVSAGLLVAVFPANVSMALRSGARLPLYQVMAGTRSCRR